MSRGAPVTAYADANLCIALLAGPPHSAHDVAVEMFRRVAEGRLVLILTPVIVAEIDATVAAAAETFAEI